MRHWFAVLVMFAVALGCAKDRTDATPLPTVNTAKEDSEPPVVTAPTMEIVTPRQSRHVLIVGDSEACAVSSYINLKKLVATINDEDGAPHDVVDVECKGGTVVQYWGDGGNLKLALQKHPKPDDVIVFLGTNHYWIKSIPETTKVPGQLTLPKVRVITDQLKDTNCIWVGNTAVHGQHWAVNGLLRDAVIPQCTYFDTEAANIELADGVHPTPAGAVKWVRLVWKEIPPKYEEADR